MKSYKINILFIILTLFLWNCHHEEDGHQHGEEDEHMTAVTLWEDSFELFMEYPVPVVNESGKYIIHLTDMSDFSAITNGSVTLNFMNKNGFSFKVESDRLLREGIFTPMVEFKTVGEYIFTLTYENDRQKKTFNIGKVFANISHDEIEHLEEEGEEGISFLKEQQWKTDFEIENVKYGSLKSSFTTVAEVIPHQNMYAEIAAPVEGIMNVHHNQELATPGSMVKKGDILAVICPPLSGSNSWTEKHLEFQRAKNEYERAKRLLEKDAISRRDFEGIEQIFKIHQAGIKPLMQSNNHGKSKNYNTDDNHFFISSPLNGIVTELTVLPGQNISYGQKIMTIINSSKVWLKLNIYEKNIYKIGEPQGAEINIPGLKSPVFLTKNEIKLVNKGEIVDPSSRTIPVLIEVKNPNKLFKIGQALQVQLYTAEEKNALVISKNAIIDEDIQKVVFIQTGGETFEKRIVKTGISNKGFIAIKDGLLEGERVVSKGAYQIKLASLNTSVGSAHVH